MVVGGYKDVGDPTDSTDSRGRSTDKTHVISLDPSRVDVPSCLMANCDFRRYAYGATSGISADGLPIVCGGREQNDLPDPAIITHYNECWKFNFTEGWVPSGEKSYNSSHGGEYGAKPVHSLREFLFIKLNHC